MKNLDDMFKGHDPERVMQTVKTFLDVFLKESGLEDAPFVKGLMEGQTAAQSMGLTREDLEVLYAVGFNALNQGDVQKAEDVFLRLVLIDPLEAKNHYCAGVTLQMKGKHKNAAEVFVNFLALDATNPDGYLRYGECLLAMGQTAEAREAFECAEAEAAKGNGDAATLAEARGKLAMLSKEKAQ